MTTANELREVAARQMKWASMAHADYLLDEHDVPDWLQRIVDAEATADHILATVHTDDDEPVTVEFIAKSWHPTPLEGSPQWWWINDRVFLCCDDMGFWTACTPDSDSESWHPFASLMTVGDVRRLCDLLGIKLKGGA